MTYRTILFLIAFIFSGLVLSAQLDTTRYFVENGKLCNKEFADSYRKVKLVDEELERYYYEDYYLDDTLKARGYFLFNRFSHKTGNYTEFYKNGNKKSKGTYFSDGKSIVGEKVNNWFYWYENGSVKLETLYGLDTATNKFNSFIINFWDTVGNKKVVDGDGDYYSKERISLGSDSAKEFTFSGKIKSGLEDGVWKGFYADGTLFSEETFNEKGLVEGKSYDPDGKVYAYTKIQVMPEFKGGDEELKRFLQRNVNYPWKEQSNDIQGTVVIRFTVGEYGKLVDAKVFRSASTNFDKEALRVVKMLPDFTPGKMRGRPVSVYYNVPVIYKLQD